MRPQFNSVFSPFLNEFLDSREKSGVRCIGADARYCKRLDNFFVNEKFDTISFTQDDAEKWKKPLPNESETDRYKRINYTKRFFEYLFLIGYPVSQLKDIKSPHSSFTPHIYTDDEIIRYFKAVDTYEPVSNKKNRIQLPVLFRILYCCGTRITETTLIRKIDVDLKEGIIRLSETKNAKQRYVVMSDSLLKLMREYADKVFYLLSEEDYIFTTQKGTPLTADWLNEVHLKILTKASIPYIGGGHGPRIHDFRHSFATHAFKQMIDSNMDMYVSLPILSTYLGHQSISATEKYLRLTVSMYPYIEEKFKVSLDQIFGEEEL